MNVSDTMTEIADQLDTISGLRVFDYVPDSLPVPAAVVAFPDTYEFDHAYSRGMDRLTLPVHCLVGRVSDRTAKGVLGAYMAGSGAQSFKEVLEAGSYTEICSLRVMSVTVSTVLVGAIDYLAATFLVDVVGNGD